MLQWLRDAKKKNQASISLLVVFQCRSYVLHSSFFSRTTKEDCDLDLLQNINKFSCRLYYYSNRIFLEKASLRSSLLTYGVIVIFHHVAFACWCHTGNTILFLWFRFVYLFGRCHRNG